MLDLNEERIGGLSDVAGWLPRYRGKKIHNSTLWRWCTRGVRGVQLEYVRLGARIVTSVEAVARFAAKLSELDQLQRADAAPPAPPKAQKKRSPTQRDRDVTRARRELERAGI